MLEVVVRNDNLAQSSVQNDPNLLWGVRVVSFPYDHRDVAGLTLGDPALIVLVEPLGHPVSGTQLTVNRCHASHCHAKEGPEGPSFTDNCIEVNS